MHTPGNQPAAAPVHTDHYDMAWNDAQNTLRVLDDMLARRGALGSAITEEHYRQYFDGPLAPEWVDVIVQHVADNGYEAFPWNEAAAASILMLADMRSRLRALRPYQATADTLMAIARASLQTACTQWLVSRQHLSADHRIVVLAPATASRH